jgi:hypothetical protein
MSSIWTSLLSLHGHVPHKNLAWRPDSLSEPVKRRPSVKVNHSVLARCAAVWPRLVGLR